MTYIVCFEGQDGVGKTTQISLLKGYLESIGYEVHYLKTPGQTPLSKDLRKLLLSPEEGKEVSGYGALGLFLTDMVDLYHREIIPLLGKVDCFILLDRFWYSTWCYQSTEGVNTDLLRGVFKDALPIEPDLKVLLDAPLEESLKRCKERGNLDHIESRPIEYHQSVFDRYQTIATLEYFKRVPVNDIESTHKQIIELIETIISSHKPARDSVLA